LRAAHPYTLTLSAALIALGIAGVSYLVLVAAMGLAGWFANEEKIRKRWNKLRPIFYSPKIQISML
jgi:hypothetical protein